MVFMDRMPMKSVVRKTTDTMDCTPPVSFWHTKSSAPVAGAQSTDDWIR